jgi:hypothetical protein
MANLDHIVLGKRSRAGSPTWKARNPRGMVGADKNLVPSLEIRRGPGRDGDGVQREPTNVSLAALYGIDFAT